MAVFNSTKAPISEVHLRALYSLLPGVLRENLYGIEFSKQLQVWRASLHPSGKTDIRILNGFDGLTVQVNLGDRLGCDIYYGFFQEYCEYSLFMALLTPNDIVVDIGANFGMYALGAAKRISSKGRVVAFEPDVRSMSLLKENIRLNKFDDLVICLDVCAGSYDGEASFNVAIDPSFSGVYDTNRSEITGNLTLPIRRLDSVMQELGVSRINKIKIDVEGAEYGVLEGATEILLSSDAIIIFEISPKNLDAYRSKKLAAALEKLEAHGYVSFLIYCEASPAELILNESIKDIIQKVGAGQTRNYFLVKRNGEQFQFIQDAFKFLNLDTFQLQEKIYSLPPINQVEAGHQPLSVQAGTDKLGNLHALLWAGEIEKRVAIKELVALTEQKKSFKTKLVETNKKLVALTEQKKSFKTKLVETNKKLVARTEQMKSFKTKLARPTRS